MSEGTGVLQTHRGGGAFIQHSPNTPTTGLRERGNDTSKSTGCSGRQKAATRRNMRREERVTVQGPVKKQQPDGMSHRRGAGPHAHGNAARQVMDCLRTEVCGQQNSQTTPATTIKTSTPPLLGAADAQMAHPATSSTSLAHQPLGSTNAETTPARAPATAANRKQQPDATCEGKNG